MLLTACSPCTEPLAAYCSTSCPTFDELRVPEPLDATDQEPKDYEFWHVWRCGPYDHVVRGHWFSSYSYWFDHETGALVGYRHDGDLRRRRCGSVFYSDIPKELEQACGSPCAYPESTCLDCEDAPPC